MHYCFYWEPGVNSPPHDLHPPQTITVTAIHTKGVLELPGALCPPVSDLQAPGLSLCKAFWLHKNQAAPSFLRRSPEAWQYVIKWWEGEKPAEKGWPSGLATALGSISPCQGSCWLQPFQSEAPSMVRDSTEPGTRHSRKSASRLFKRTDFLCCDIKASLPPAYKSAELFPASDTLLGWLEMHMPGRHGTRTTKRCTYLLSKLFSWPCLNCILLPCPVTLGSQHRLGSFRNITEHLMLAQCSGIRWNR